MTATQHTRFLVVGGGITGLAFANFCDDDDYLLIEADEALGGYCKTIRQDGFTWDYSGHFFHFKDPSIERWLLDGIDGELRRVRRVANIYHRGTTLDFPFQKNIHQLPKDDFIDCLHSLYFRDETYPSEPPATDFLGLLRQNFGDGITERFLRPYNEKLYACTLDTLDAGAMGRFFPWADLDDIIRNFKAPDDSGYNAHFTYPRGGAIAYIDAAARDLDPSRLHLNEALVRVDLEARIAHTTRRAIHFDTLVSTIPLDRLLGACDLPAPKAHFSYNRVLVFNLGFDGKGPAGVHWTYYPDPELRFYRVGYYDNIFQDARMSLYVEIGLPAEGEVNVEAELKRVLQDLQEVGVLREQTLLSWHHVLLSPAYVHIGTASQAYVSAQREALAAHGVYSIGRYGSWTYCGIEDNIVEARALADALR